jgi:hypothetical protein
LQAGEKVLPAKAGAKSQQVLKPEQRVAQNQRINQRKELLKQHLKIGIQHCNNAPQLKRYMEQQGYRVELGRGIAFTDAQQVRFKGSQVGYALLDIEKLLQFKLHRQQERESIQEQRKSQKEQMSMEEATLKEVLAEVLNELQDVKRFIEVQQKTLQGTQQKASEAIQNL